MAAPATPVALNGTADTTLRSTTGAVYGIAVRESAGTPAAAKFVLRAISNTGIIVIPVTLAASQTVIVSFPDGVMFDRGIYEDYTSGTYEGSVFIGPA